LAIGLWHGLLAGNSWGSPTISAILSSNSWKTSKPTCIATSYMYRLIGSLSIGLTIQGKLGFSINYKMLCYSKEQPWRSICKGWHLHSKSAVTTANHAKELEPSAVAQATGTALPAATAMPWFGHFKKIFWARCQCFFSSSEMLWKNRLQSSFPEKKHF